MKKEILINSTVNEVRIAITENGRLGEYFIDLPDKEKIIGNIYLGKVNKIVQGINAAFVDIGLKQDAFLHFSDVDESLENNVLVEDDDDDEDLAKPVKKTKKSKEQIKTDIALRKSHALKNNISNSAKFSTKSSGDIQINIQEGQDIIVQVTREAYGTKGVKVTSKVALPGRYVVFMPFESWIGVSKKINSFKERKRLRRIAKKVLPEGAGCIIRTVSAGKTDEELFDDWKSLLETWDNVESKVKYSTPPSLLYQDLHLTSSIIRDLFTKDVNKVVIDSRKLYNEIVDYLKNKSPQLVKKVEYYKGKNEIFDEYGIGRDIANTFKRQVNLKSGASFVIDQTEAMIVVDVNSGRSVNKNQEATALNTNMEAASEIARQMRLRDLAGIVLIDFIDMTDEKNRKKLYFEMKNELNKDRAKTVVFPLTKLGLMQITRQRINQNISEKISEVCPTCNGTGRVKNKRVLLNQIERWLKNFRTNSKEFRLILAIHPDMAEYLTEGKLSILSKLMIKYFVKIKIKQSESLNLNQFVFYSTKKQKDITREYLDGS